MKGKYKRGERKERRRRGKKRSFNTATFGEKYNAETFTENFMRRGIHYESLCIIFLFSNHCPSWRLENIQSELICLLGVKERNAAPIHGPVELRMKMDESLCEGATLCPASLSASRSDGIGCSRMVWR